MYVTYRAGHVRTRPNVREDTIMYRGIDWGEREAGVIAVGAVLIRTH
jgi:hypothetical protein